MLVSAANTVAPNRPIFRPREPFCKVSVLLFSVRPMLFAMTIRTEQIALVDFFEIDLTRESHHRRELEPFLRRIAVMPLEGRWMRLTATITTTRAFDVVQPLTQLAFTPVHPVFLLTPTLLDCLRQSSGSLSVGYGVRTSTW